MNKIITIIILIIVVVVGGALIWQWMANTQMANSPNTASNTDQNAQNSATASQNNTPAKLKGTMYVSLTDAALNMKNVTAVNVTIDKVQVSNLGEGWVTLSQTPQTFNLLDLKAKSQAVVIGKASLSSGTWNEFKLHVSKVMVTSSGATKQATLPSSDVYLKTEVMVNSNTNSVAQFDILADKSLYQTTAGDFIFAPVITFTSRMNATVNVNASTNVIAASYGQTNAAVNVGMDIDGQLKNNFAINPNTVLNVNAAGKIELVPTILLK